jgi:hypothetical protein
MSARNRPVLQVPSIVLHDSAATRERVEEGGGIAGRSADRFDLTRTTFHGTTGGGITGFFAAMAHSSVALLPGQCGSMPGADGNLKIVLDIVPHRTHDSCHRNDAGRCQEGMIPQYPDHAGPEPPKDICFATIPECGSKLRHHQW